MNLLDTATESFVDQEGYNDDNSYDQDVIKEVLIQETADAWVKQFLVPEKTQSIQDGLIETYDFVGTADIHPDLQSEIYLEAVSVFSSTMNNQISNEISALEFLDVFKKSREDKVNGFADELEHIFIELRRSEPVYMKLNDKIGKCLKGISKNDVEILQRTPTDKIINREHGVKAADLQYFKQTVEKMPDDAEKGNLFKLLSFVDVTKDICYGRHVELIIEEEEKKKQSTPQLQESSEVLENSSVGQGDDDAFKKFADSVRNLFSTLWALIRSVLNKLRRHKIKDKAIAAELALIDKDIEEYMKIINQFKTVDDAAASELRSKAKTIQNAQTSVLQKRQSLSELAAVVDRAIELQKQKNSNTKEAKKLSVRVTSFIGLISGFGKTDQSFIQLATNEKIFYATGAILTMIILAITLYGLGIGLMWFLLLLLIKFFSVLMIMVDSDFIKEYIRTGWIDAHQAKTLSEYSTNIKTLISTEFMKKMNFLITSTGMDTSLRKGLEETTKSLSEYYDREVTNEQTTKIVKFMHDISEGSIIKTTDHPSGIVTEKFDSEGAMRINGFWRQFTITKTISVLGALFVKRVVNFLGRSARIDNLKNK